MGIKFPRVFLPRVVKIEFFRNFKNSKVMWAEFNLWQQRKREVFSMLE